jgi:hypothetical protein
MPNQTLIAGRWVPAIPLRAPIDVRWRCDHRWTPHVHSTGAESTVDFDCTRCGDSCEAAGRPNDGPYRLRSQLACIFGRGS